MRRRLGSFEGFEGFELLAQLKPFKPLKPFKQLYSPSKFPKQLVQ